MKYVIGMLVNLALVSVWCSATTISDPRQRQLLDRLSTKAAAPSENSAAALELLKLIALGRTAEISEDSEAQGGVAPGELRQKDFTDSSLRVYAFQKIGELDLPASIDFLSKLDQADIGIDVSGAVWPAAQAALANALLGQIADPQLKLQFLERTVKARGPATSWAVEQLCNWGPPAEIALVSDVISKMWSGQYGEDRVRFCEARMQVIAGSPDRVKALGSVLTVNGGTVHDELLTWATTQLSEIRSADADSELRRFMAEIEKLPRGTAQQQRLLVFRDAIKSTLQRGRQSRSPWE